MMTKELKPNFSKNGLEYTLIKRNKKIALFRLGPQNYPDGYEVSRIYIMKAHEAFGVSFKESEIMTSDEQFITDGSGSFRDLGDALRHFDKMTDKYVRQDYVDDLSSSDTEVIAECLAVEDNATQDRRTRVRTASFKWGSSISYNNRYKKDDLSLFIKKVA